MKPETMTVDQLIAEIKKLVARSDRSLYDAGKALCHMHSLLTPSALREVIEQNLPFSVRKAYQLMQVYNKFETCGIPSSVITDLGWTKVYIALSALTDTGWRKLVAYAKTATVDELREHVYSGRRQRKERVTMILTSDAKSDLMRALTLLGARIENRRWVGLDAAVEKLSSSHLGGARVRVKTQVSLDGAHVTQ